MGVIKVNVQHGAAKIMENSISGGSCLRFWVRFEYFALVAAAAEKCDHYGCRLV